MAMTAVEALTHHQRQLDADGVEVGVSRQALDEVLALFAGQQRALRMALNYLENTEGEWGITLDSADAIRALRGADHDES